MGDAAGDVDRAVSVDSTVNRAHQHATDLPRAEIPTGASANYVNRPAGLDPLPDRAG